MTKQADAAVLTRRSVLAALSVGAIGTAVEAAPRAIAVRGGSPSGAPARNLETAEIAEWRALIGQRFQVAGNAPLTLVEVEADRSAGRRPAQARRRGFAAVFEGRAARAPQGDSVYWLAHGTSAPLPLLLGPKAEAGGKARFVAILN